MIAIKHNATTSTNMRANRQRLLDHCSACRAFLAGVLGWDGDHGDSMYIPVVVQPADECPPSCIMDRFGEFAVTYHIPDLKVFIGNQVARRDVRVCYFASKILTLPLHFQVLLGKSLSGFLAISRFLLLTRESSLKSFELVFRFAVVPGVVDCHAFRVSQVRFESHINAQLRARWDMLNLALSINTELAIIAVCLSDNAHTLDQLHWELFHPLALVSNQLETAYPTAICEGDMTTIKFPTRGLVLHTAVVVLKLGIALLSRLLLLAVVVEARNSKPSAISRCLTGHGIEETSKGVCFGKYSTVGLQVVFRDTRVIHPQPQRLVTDELDRPDSLINSSIVFLAAIQLVLIDQHMLLIPRLFFYILLNSITTHIPCCAVESRSCPQRRHSQQVRELFPQIMRRSAFNLACNVGWQGVGVASEKEMNMVWLDCQRNDLPSILMYYFFNDLLQTVVYWPYQDFASPLRTPNDVVDEQMDRVLFMDIVVSHVRSIRHLHVLCQRLGPLCPNPKKGRPIHPLVKTEGLSGSSAVTPPLSHLILQIHVTHLLTIIYE